MPNLPAPYVSPWREIGRLLVAAAADLRLRAQELWRRNREGDLPRPGFWPDQLAPLFWPALAAAMAMLLATVIALMPLTGQPDHSASSHSDPVPSAAAGFLETTASPPPSQQQPETSQPPETVDNPMALADDSEEFVDAEERVLPVALPDSEQSAQPSPVVTLVMEESEDWSTNQLRLTLSLRLWSALSAAERDQRATTWLRAAEERGFEALVLVDEEDRPLGRSARVGEGMILFNRSGAA